jgi:hypothetical protein
MKSHGIHNYNFSGLSTSEQMGMVGRGMSAVTLAIVLGPAVKALGIGKLFSGE